MARVLIADDDPWMLELLTFALEDAGYSVFSVDDGDLVLDRAKIEKPDVIVLDGIMPGRDGLDVLRDLRADSALGQTCIIMLSARKRQDDVVGGLKEGADDYLTKPFLPEELITRVEKHLARQRA